MIANRATDRWGGPHPLLMLLVTLLAHHYISVQAAARTGNFRHRDDLRARLQAEVRATADTLLGPCTSASSYSTLIEAVCDHMINGPYRRHSEAEARAAMADAIHQHAHRLGIAAAQPAAVEHDALPDLDALVGCCDAMLLRMWQIGRLSYEAIARIANREVHEVRSRIRRTLQRVTASTPGSTGEPPADTGTC
jgi:hypothetical protein